MGLQPSKEIQKLKRHELATADDYARRATRHLLSAVAAVVVGMLLLPTSYAIVSFLFPRTLAEHVRQERIEQAATTTRREYENLLKDFSRELLQAGHSPTAVIAEIGYFKSLPVEKLPTYDFSARPVVTQLPPEVQAKLIQYNIRMQEDLVPFLKAQKLALNSLLATPADEGARQLIQIVTALFVTVVIVFMATMFAFFVEHSRYYSLLAVRHRTLVSSLGLAPAEGLSAGDLAKLRATIVKEINLERPGNPLTALMKLFKEVIKLFKLGSA